MSLPAAFAAALVEREEESARESENGGVG